MTMRQAIGLMSFAEYFSNPEELYKFNYNDPVFPYQYSDKIGDFVQYCYANELVVDDYSEISDSLNQNYENQEWINTLTKHQVLQAISHYIRLDRFVDGLLLSGIRYCIPQLLNRLKEIYGVDDRMLKMKDEFTTEMHAEFTVDEETDLKHRVWALIGEATRRGKTPDSLLNTYRISKEDFEKYKSSYPV